MNRLFKIYFGLTAILFVVLTSCNQIDFQQVDESKLLGDSLITTYTVEELITEFTTDSDRYTDLTRNGTNSGLFTAKQIVSDQDVVISGRVTTTDTEGNVYKYIIIQEETTGRAMKISIDVAGLSGIYPLGQKVWVKCNGLYLGKYAQSYQLGTNYYNLEKSVNDTVNDVVVYRHEPGRLSLPLAKQAIHAYGLPDVSKVIADTLTIAQIKSMGYSVINRLVCIKNAYFTGNGADYNLPKALTSSADFIFAPSTDGVGYPQSREIQDGTGSIFVSTSEYSRFASTALPASTYIGNITAIVGWYNDKKPTVSPLASTAEIYHQLTIRGLFDLGSGFEGYHQEIGE